MAWGLGARQGDCGSEYPGDRRLLLDRPDGGRRQADPVIVRAALYLCGRHRGRADDGVRDVRRHARHDVGADH